MPKQYWVIGDEYRDLECRNTIEGAARVFEPSGTDFDARSI